MTTTQLERWERKAEWSLGARAVAFLVLYSVEVLDHTEPRSPSRTA